MEKMKKDFIKWVKTHKIQLAIAGISSVTVICIITGVMKKDAIIELWTSLQNSISKTPAKLSQANSHIPKTLEAHTTVMEPIVEPQEVIKPYTLPTSPFNVKLHKRNLPEGWHASPEKVAEAKLLGIDLQPNQTFVISYTKGEIAA